jgi:hypothetical protein
MKYLKIGLSALGGVLVALVLYGAGQYYFKKPTPIINNTTVQPGATLNVEQNKSTRSGGHLYTGIYGGRSGAGTDLGLEVGWIW